MSAESICCRRVRQELGDLRADKAVGEVVLKSTGTSSSSEFGGPILSGNLRGEGKSKKLVMERGKMLDCDESGVEANSFCEPMLSEDCQFSLGQSMPKGE